MADTKVFDAVTPEDAAIALEPTRYSKVPLDELCAGWLVMKALTAALMLLNLESPESFPRD